MKVGASFRRREALGAMAAVAWSGPSFAAETSRSRRARRSRERDEAQAEDEEGTWRDLWNRVDLAGFESWLGIPPANIAGLDVPRGADGKYREPMGLGRDPRRVFSVVDQVSSAALRISGEIAGVLSTSETLSDYHLRIDWRWGAQKWPPRAHLKRDSGLIYHGHGAHGSGDAGRSCMKGLGFQIKEGDTGDLLAFGARADVPAQTDRFMGKPVMVYRPASRLMSFPRDGYDRRVVKYEDHERGLGEWNRTDLFVLGADSLHVVNGSLDMRVFNARLVDDGGGSPLREGRVQLVSEGAEVFVRRLAVRPLKAFPERFARRGARHHDDDARAEATPGE
jgi:hypothetical protein